MDKGDEVSDMSTPSDASGREEEPNVRMECPLSEQAEVTENGVPSTTEEELTVPQGPPEDREGETAEQMPEVGSLCGAATEVPERTPDGASGSMDAPTGEGTGPVRTGQAVWYPWYGFQVVPPREYDTEDEEEAESDRIEP